MRVALLTNILSPYRLPVFEALAATPGLRLRVVLDAATEFDRGWKLDTGALDVQIVSSWSIRRRVGTRGRRGTEQIVTTYIPSKLLGALRRFRPDVVVSGQLGPRTIFALLYCRIFRVPLVIWSYHSRVESAGTGSFRKLLQRALLSRASAVIGMGTQTREVLRALGVSERRIFDAPNAHDDEACARALSSMDRIATCTAVRNEHGCRERIALVAGRLIPVKGIELLLARWQALPEPLRKGWTLLFLGSGPLEPRIRAAALRCEAGEIACIPEVAPADVYDFYAASDLLVFPSLGDNWGLVVNEAFACELPVLCSRLAGCCDDLVRSGENRSGENGWTFDPTHRREFASVLKEALESTRLAELGANAREAAKRFGSADMADGMRRAVEFALREEGDLKPPHQPDRARGRKGSRARF